MTMPRIVNTDDQYPDSKDVEPDSQSPFVVTGVSEQGGYAVVPAAAVALHCIDLPVRNESQARRAAPFAIEDEIAVDLAGTHVAVGLATETGARVLAVVSRAKMESWAGALPTLDDGQKLVPEVSALAAALSPPVVVDRQGHVIVAFTDGTGFAVETDVFQRIAGPLFVEHDLSELTVYTGRPERIVPKALPAQCKVEVQPALSEARYTALIAEGAVKANLSLLQGPYAFRTPWSAALRSWRAVLACAALLLISYCLSLVSEAVYYSRATDEYFERTEAIARQALPDVQRIVNPRTQVLARLNGLGGAQQASFLPMASALYAALNATADTRLEALVFDQARGTLSATISMESYQDIDKLRADIARRGFELEEGASRTSERRIVSELKVAR